MYEWKVKVFDRLGFEKALFVTQAENAVEVARNCVRQYGVKVNDTAKIATLVWRGDDWCKEGCTVLFNERGVARFEYGESACVLKL